MKGTVARLVPRRDQPDPAKLPLRGCVSNAAMGTNFENPRDTGLGQVGPLPSVGEFPGTQGTAPPQSELRQLRAEAGDAAGHNDLTQLQGRLGSCRG